MSAFQLFAFVIASLILSEIGGSGIELPCEFAFDSKFGYTCRVLSSFSNDNQYAEISVIAGDHLYRNDVNHRGRNDSDVHRLVFWNHQLDYLPGNITRHFTSLRTLQAKNCGLKALTRSSELNTLRRFYLGFNEIEIIPKTFFWSFCRLEILSLFNNRISQIDKMAFRDLINLKRISLNKNRITSLDSELFENCVNLEVVDLDNNELRAVNGDLFANQAHLQKIYLQNNRIAAIDSHFLSQVINWKLSHVHLNGNECIDFVYPKDGDYQEMQKIFIENCEPPPVTTTRAPKTTTIVTRKPKYKTPQILYFAKCKWKVHEDYAHLYRNAF